MHVLSDTFALRLLRGITVLLRLALLESVLRGLHVPPSATHFNKRSLPRSPPPRTMTPTSADATHASARKSLVVCRGVHFGDARVRVSTQGRLVCGEVGII